MQVVKELVQIKRTTGKSIHIDIEPEPDGLLQNGEEFFQWYINYLLPKGTIYLREELGCTAIEANDFIKEHIQLCYDVCHFAIGFENPDAILKKAQENGIKVGKIQISAALKAVLGNDQQREKVINAFKEFNDSFVWASKTLNDSFVFRNVS